MHFTVLRSKKLFHVRFVTNNINLSIVNYAYNTSMGNSIQCLGR